MQDASSTTKRSSRCDGQASRERLLAEALRLFAENGFAQTSTRAIAQAAGVNISALVNDAIGREARRLQAERWKADNREGMEEVANFIMQHGSFADENRSW